MGKILGREDRAQQFIDYHRRVYEEIKAKTASIPEDKKPRVLYLYNEKLRVAGRGTPMDFWIQLTGAKNVAQEVSWFGEVSMEQIMAWNPEIIYIRKFHRPAARRPI